MVWNELGANERRHRETDHVTGRISPSQWTKSLLSRQSPKPNTPDKYSRRTISALLHGIKLQGCGHVITGGFKAIFKKELKELPSDPGCIGYNSWGVICVTLLGLDCHDRMYRMSTLSPGSNASADTCEIIKYWINCHQYLFYSCRIWNSDWVFRTVNLLWSRS